MFSWYTRPGPVSCQFLIPVSSDTGDQGRELLLPLTRGGGRTLGAQIEGQLRSGIREGALRPGVQLPSTRDLAGQLGVSRRIVVEAYSQLAAEGYLALRQGARPTVASAAVPAPDPTSDAAAPPRVRFDFRISAPDVSTFPRTSWLRSLRDTITAISDTELGYGDARGAERLRTGLSGYLGRVRGVVSDPAQVLVTYGSTEGHALFFRVLAAAGHTRIAFEDPCLDDHRHVARRAGLEPVPVEVDGSGIRVDRLRETGVRAVVLTPAHQHPTGVVLSGERRADLLEWLRAAEALAIEDDYDAEFRYDRAPVGALQGLAPQRVVYAGTASKTLAPALRVGWLVAPPSLVEALAEEKRLTNRGGARIEQHAFADFLERGEYDRHLRRMRVRYRRRRDALVAALRDRHGEAEIQGIAAGLHAVVQLKPRDDEAAILSEAERRGVRVATLAQFCVLPREEPPTLLLGYAQLGEAAIAAGVEALAAAVAAARGR